MSSIKTFAGFAVVVGALVFGARSERQEEIEADADVRQIVETAVRQNAVDFNPKVSLTPPPLQGFDLISIQITRPRIRTMFPSALGPDCDVYVRFREGDGERCMVLDLRWLPETESWKAAHTGVDDRCAPIW